MNQSAVFLQDTKNGSPHSVPLNNEARAVTETITPIQKRKDLVFKSKRLDSKLSIYKAFYNALEIAGISDLHIHIAGTYFAQQQLNLKHLYSKLKPSLATRHYNNYHVTLILQKSILDIFLMG